VFADDDLEQGVRFTQLLYARSRGGGFNDRRTWPELVI
jgi:hypothetical protein